MVIVRVSECGGSSERVTDCFCAAVFASVEWCALDVNVLPDLDLFNERSA